MKIIIKRDKCIGCASCANICSRFFEMRDDGRAGLKGGELEADYQEFIKVEEAGCAKKAEQVCPAQCIVVEE